MAVSQVKEVIAKRTASRDRETRKRTRTFLVHTTSLADGPLTVEAGVGVSLWDSYSSGNDSDTSAYCTSIEVSEVDANKWQVVCNYENIEKDSTCEQDPTTCQPEISWTTTNTEEIVEEDVNGAAIVNSAEDPFDPPVVRETAHINLDYTYNVANFDGSTAFSYANKVNSATFEGAAAGTLKISGIRAQTQKHEDIGNYWQVTLSMAYKPDGWQASILDQGMRYLDGTTAKPILLDGREITSPKLLDGTGQVLAPGGTPVFLDFDIYEELDFSTI